MVASRAPDYLPRVRHDRGTRAQAPRAYRRRPAPGQAQPPDTVSWLLEQRSSQRSREEIIQIKVQLRDDAGATTRTLIHGNHRLDAELHVATCPQNAGIHRASRSTTPVERRLHG